MKKIISILLLIFFFETGYAQEKVTKCIPTLFDTVNVGIQYKRKRLEIKDTFFSDSSRIQFKVALKFKHPLNDTTKLVCIKSVTLLYLEIQSLRTKDQYRIDLLEKNNWSDSQRNIWNRYAKMFKYWYTNQPYEKMIGRQTYGSKAYFGGVLYAMPR